MRIVVTNKKTAADIATIDIDANGAVNFSRVADQGFRNFLEQAIQEGIPNIQEVVDTTKGSRFIMETSEPVSNADFPRVLEQFLTRRGYRVDSIFPEEDEEIKDLLAAFPDDNTDKVEIVARLPQMSRLEKTFILRALRDRSE